MVLVEYINTIFHLPLVNDSHGDRCDLHESGFYTSPLLLFVVIFQLVAFQDGLDIGCGSDGRDFGLMIIIVEVGYSGQSIKVYESFHLNPAGATEAAPSMFSLKSHP